MTFDFNAIANEVAAVQADTNVAQAGGSGGYTPPPKGLARLRFIGYVEIGKHVKKVPGKPDKLEDQAWLIFELSGKGYEPKVLESGEKIPYRITVKLNKSLNEKATYFKLFKRMNYEQTASHFAQLLGKAYLGNVGHFVLPAREAGGEQTVIANFRDDAGNLTIRPPRIEAMDEETGEVIIKTIPVAEAVSAVKLFVWASKPEWLGKMWESIYIPTPTKEDGDGEDYRSRNILQDAIKSAENFAGSPIAQYLESKGVDMGIPAAVDAKAGKGAAVAEETAEDILNGL